MKKKSLKNIKILIFIILMVGLFFLIFKENEKQIYVQEPIVDESTQASDTMIGVEIKGAIKNPGFYTLNENTRVNDLIIKAGGFVHANEFCINLAQYLHDSQSFFVKSKDAPCEETTLININTATEKQLLQINGVGPAKAQAIIKYREEQGAFEKVEDIKKVSGFGEKMFLTVKDVISV